jgi:serine/threonine protein kinase/TolB-like protein/tetratricopeptide (TPR) repeat protein
MARRDPEVLSTLLDQALSVPLEARAAFLDEECRNDQPLREEIRSLLIAHDASSGYFERLSEQIVSPALMALSSDVGDELLVGQTFAQYRIVEKLATGGMGVVFKALDQRLERFVALKFLPAPLSTDAGSKRRLLTEAKAASALDHPNIGVVHDIGEAAAGRLFIVMAYYEGETLERRNQRGGLSTQDALALTRQIAGALAAAHRNGIVHRDIKPSNILITRDGTAKLLDFGIAMLLGSTPARDGAVVGTVAYMSPEQTRAVIVDHRTDLWSLGVVLYEMLTGLRPFRADDDALIHAIRYGGWQPVDRVNSEMPLAITRILEHCLAKDPNERYGTAEELLSDLDALERAAFVPSSAATRGDRWRSLRYASAAAVLCVIAAGTLYVQDYGTPRLDQAVGVQTRGNRLAVLPVTLIDSDKDESYLADGMTEELIAQLSRIGGLRVIARSSIIGYSGASKSPTEIGRELAVATVLHGSVHKAGGQLQIAMHLVDTNTQEQLWTRNYTAPASELQSLQREIAFRVAEVLRVQVHTPEQRQLARVGTSSAAAYLFYLKGLHFLDKRNDPTVRQAKNYFERALDLDPTFARAWTGLGDTYSALSALATLRAADAYPQSRAAAERALQIDPDLPEAHVTLATALSTYYWQFDAAAEHYRRALELNPSYANAHRLHAEYLRFEGRFDEALAEARQGEELDPLSPAHQIETGIDLYWARRYDEAIAQFRRVLGVNPQFTYARFFLALVLIQKQQYDDALSALDVPGTGGSLQQETLRGYIHAVSGRKAEARKGLDRLTLLARAQNISSWHSAIIHMGLGEHDRALDLIEQAYRDRDWQVRMVPVEPLLDPLRSHPRFRVLADKIR